MTFFLPVAIIALLAAAALGLLWLAARERQQAERRTRKQPIPVRSDDGRPAPRRTSSDWE
jgi:hypothetical protein